MLSSPTRLLTSITLNLPVSQLYELLLDELGLVLHLQGIKLEAQVGSYVLRGSQQMGHVLSLDPGKRIEMQWRLTAWQPDVIGAMVFTLEPDGEGTKITLECRGLDFVLPEQSDILGWFTSQVAGSLLRSAAPDAVGDWITDRKARRPSGESARKIYRDPLYHYPNFRVILRELALTADDHLLEVGCGGGAMLKSALATGCRAAAIDHSPDMVRLASQENRDAIVEGRLQIFEADAHHLPFPDEVFTCATMTGVLGFLQDPVAALSEMLRVLKRGGRIVVMGTDPELRNTPAAPEPIASRLHFYDDRELERIGREAGFADVIVRRHAMEQFAREAGIPEEQLSLFGGPGARFLTARKASRATTEV